MSIIGSVKVNSHPVAEILRRKGLDMNGDVQQFHTANVLRRIVRYMPYRTGATIKLTQAQSPISRPEINNFVSALYDLFAECAERYEADKDKKFENNTAFFEYVRQRDAEVSGGVDRLFGEDTAAAVFQGHSAHAMAEGLPLWTNFFLAVIDTVPEEMSKQIRASKPRVEKYLKKYHR